MSQEMKRVYITISQTSLLGFDTEWTRLQRVQFKFDSAIVEQKSKTCLDTLSSSGCRFVIKASGIAHDDDSRSYNKAWDA